MNGNPISKLDEITEQYYTEIYKFCLRKVQKPDIAKDITHEVFLALTSYFYKIDLATVRNWLYNIARKKIADYFREFYKKRDNETSISDLNINDLSELMYDPNNYLTDEEIIKIKKEIISKLNESEKELYIDRFNNRLDYTKMANKYNVSEATMRKRVSRLKAEILKLISAYLGVIIFSVFR